MTEQQVIPANFVDEFRPSRGIIVKLERVTVSRDGKTFRLKCGHPFATNLVFDLVESWRKTGKGEKKGSMMCPQCLATSDYKISVTVDPAFVVAPEETKGLKFGKEVRVGDDFIITIEGDVEGAPGGYIRGSCRHEQRTQLFNDLVGNFEAGQTVLDLKRGMTDTCGFCGRESTFSVTIKHSPEWGQREARRHLARMLELKDFNEKVSVLTQYVRERLDSLHCHYDPLVVIEAIETFLLIDEAREELAQREATKK